MMGNNRTSSNVIVGGHICLDIIPRLRRQHFEFIPGALEELGEATISTGGCVSNTGIALSRLGASVELVSRIGDDLLGDLLKQCLTKQGVDSNAMRQVPGEHTSYSIILSPEGADRMVLHHPGTNDTFTSSDLSEVFEKSATLFHFGYPPLMHKMYCDGGTELREVFKKAKASGLITSLDLAYPDPASRAGRADWHSILTKVLPDVDIFLPSYEEIVYMLLGPRPENFWIRDEPDEILYDQIQSLASSLLAMGASIVVLKLGTRGIYLRTGPKRSMENLSTILDIDEWASRELWTTVFETNVASTNGAGDCTIAGFLYAILRGFSPELACTAACAVGACSVESADATSAVQPWGSVDARLDKGWTKRQSVYLTQWTELASGVFAGQLDGAKRH